MSVIERSSSKFAYSISLLSMGDDGREVIGSTSENSSLSEENGKTDYRLSLPSSSQLQSCRLNLNSSISERRKKCLTRIITIVAIFLLVVCILLVTLTLRLAHKIDELVRSKQLMPRPNTFLLVSSTTTTTTPTTTNPPFRRRTTTSSLVHWHLTLGMDKALLQSTFLVCFFFSSSFDSFFALLLSHINITITSLSLSLSIMSIRYSPSSSSLQFNSDTMAKQSQADIDQLIQRARVNNPSSLSSHSLLFSRRIVI